LILLDGRRIFPVMREFVRRVPDGDNRERLICGECGFVAYENPKIVVGSVVAADGCVLLCRRAIAPRVGFWTLPAGYLELGETVEEGARREAEEEAGTEIALDGILAVYSISRLGQVQIFFRARFGAAGPVYAAGPESQEVRLFSWEEIPWDDIAFPSVRWALNAWRRAGEMPIGAPEGNPQEDRRGEARLLALAEGAL
jgi:ADP-ribose pyrophosphatase YjhB (NUDIX family)